jgi:hypothetical protein
MDEKSLDSKELTLKFERMRRGVTDPARLAAAELQNITDVLLEIRTSTKQ